MYGKKIPVPREESLFGDDFRYEYRGALIKAQSWPDFLLETRDRIQALSGLTFNFAVDMSSLVSTHPSAVVQHTCGLAQ